ncbi:hypothetical protein [Vibrio cincinnatiensis]|uniref:hypothetical protein n=1 Tax=Vibrio cincinnatiensis TaxID=675 RepID=UPI001EDD1E15|nr:hypothetical protein [Vibrio cincinnatiensis]MCG3731068.1 hypothetical protein [Vibrio cincinnatiensis]
MNKFTALLPLVILAGCSTTPDSSKASTEQKFLKNDITQHKVGSNSSNLGTVHFSLLSNDSIQSTVEVNFEQLPFRTKFDLCENTGNYNDLKKVRTDKNGDTYPTYENKKVDCNSEVIVTKDIQGNYLVSYNLNFLVGYNVASVKGYDVLLPQKIKRLIENRFVQGKAVESTDKKVQIVLDI